ncbi:MULTISPECIES: efflux transporter outer membrane subunit [unclassified Stenotrophomonas]|uniref:efflux transporter outer membrane subunit n=1 Tax=unclassified Stenotrophomonas TaxID=196198 RepID=UPI0020C7DEB5|nr:MULTISPECIES: efflux transporter outer membrane subunit [unclassified Stenotrophomonas]MDX5514187.1 efflux transporter outer membrane subunit [Stenotrophomonas sp. RG-453]
MRRQTVRLMAGSALCTALAACTLGPDFVRPQASLPAQWEGGVITSAAFADDAAWWNGFEDPLLVALASQAMRANLDVQLAANRVAQSRALRRSSAADRVPAVGATVGATRARNSEVGLNDPSGNAGREDYGLFQAGIGLGWELDLWGRVRRQVEIADARVQIANEDWHAVQTAVMAETARTYLQLRATRQLLTITEDNLHIARDVQRLTLARQQQGVATTLQVASAAAQVAALEARLAPLQHRQSQLRNALAMLLARSPRALDEQLDAARHDWPALPALATGLPSDLVKRRPDIRRAEAALHAATAGIGVAKTSFLPRITLTGDAGFQARQLDDLDGWNAHRFSIGPAISLPIFQGGRLKANLALSRLQERQAGLQFQKTVLQAWHEVDDAIGGYGAEQQRGQALQVAVQESERALAAARRQYQAGVIDMLDVLTTQRIALDNQAALADSQAAAAIARVDLYRALGGGWREVEEGVTRAGSAPAASGAGNADQRTLRSSQ